jgi:hypothetical protein
MKFNILQFSPWSIFLPFRSKYLPQHTVLKKTLSLCSSLKVRDQVSHPYSTTGKITVPYILIFRVFLYETGRQKILNYILIFSVVTDQCRKSYG